MVLCSLANNTYKNIIVKKFTLCLLLLCLIFGRNQLIQAAATTCRYLSFYSAIFGEIRQSWRRITRRSGKPSRPYVIFILGALVEAPGRDYRWEEMMVP